MMTISVALFVVDALVFDDASRSRVLQMKSLALDSLTLVAK